MSRQHGQDARVTGKLLVALLALLSLASGARAGGYDLLAHGTQDVFWSAEVVPSTDPANPSDRTIFRYRISGDGARWRPLAEISARAINLSDRGRELLVVLENGEWRAISPDSHEARSGATLPRGGGVVVLAGDPDSLWAVGEDIPEKAAPGATNPSATRATTTTFPVMTTAPSGSAPPTTTTQPVRLALFSMEKGEWIRRAVMPAPITAEQVFGMALVDRRPLLAVAGADSALNVWQFTEKGWSAPTRVTTLVTGDAVDLAELRGQPIIAITRGGATSLYLGGDKWTGPVDVKVTKPIAQLPYRTAVTALGQLRLLASDAKVKFVEQAYNTDGTPSGNAVAADLTPAVSTERIMYGLQVLAMVVVVLVMLGSMRRRQALLKAVEDIDRLHVAPLGLRFAAALLDASPLIIAMVIAMPQNVTSDFSSVQFAAREWWVILGGLLVYLLHTTLTEMLTTRTLGKMLFGLRVVSLDGSRPGMGPLLLRNAMRLIDVLLLLPLSLMVFLPLRQRIGDLAAGTVVARDASDVESEA